MAEILHKIYEHSIDDFYTISIQQYIITVYFLYYK